MAAPVAGQKGRADPAQPARQDVVRGCAKGAVHLSPFRALKPVYLIDARAADHANHALCHPAPPWVGSKSTRAVSQAAGGREPANWYFGLFRPRHGENFTDLRVILIAKP